MAMRNGFVGPSNKIYYYSIEWDSKDMSWEHFRGQLLGPTNPADAPAGSVRGAIFKDWKALGLAAEPTVGDNCAHASASPLEGLVEKLNWLEKKPEEESFGRLLLEKGITAETIKGWGVDPHVKGGGKPGGEQTSGSVWDAVEDMDAAECGENLVKLNALNPPAATCTFALDQKYVVGLGLFAAAAAIFFMA